MSILRLVRAGLCLLGVAASELTDCAADTEPMSVLQTQAAQYRTVKQGAKALEEHMEAIAMASQQDGEEVPAAECVAGGNYCPSLFKFYTGNICGSTGPSGAPCYAVGQDPGQYKACPNEMAATQFCASGENKNCVDPSTGNSFVSWWMYCSFPISGMNPDQSTMFYIQYDCQDVGCTSSDTPWAGCPSGTVITGLCASGKNPDCNGNLMKVTCTTVPASVTVAGQDPTCYQPLGGSGECCDFVVKPCDAGSVLTEVLSSGRDQNIKCNGRQQHNGAFCSAVTLPAPPDEEFTPDNFVGYWTMVGSASGSFTFTESMEWSSSLATSTSHEFSQQQAIDVGVSVKVGTGMVENVAFRAETTASASYGYTWTYTDTTTQTNTQTQGGSSSVAVQIDCVGYVWQWVQNQSQTATDSWALTKSNYYVCTKYGTQAYMPACPARECAQVTWTDSDPGCGCCVDADWTTNQTLGEASLCDELK